MVRGLQAPPHGNMCAAAWARRHWTQSFACGRLHAKKLEPAPVPRHTLCDWCGLNYGYTKDMTNQPLQQHAVAILDTKMIKQHEDGKPWQTEPRTLNTAKLYWAIRTRTTKAIRANTTIPARARNQQNHNKFTTSVLQKHHCIIQVSQLDVAATHRDSTQANHIT